MTLTKGAIEAVAEVAALRTSGSKTVKPQILAGLGTEDFRV